jgi:hypothetical protein
MSAFGIVHRGHGRRSSRVPQGATAELSSGL